MMVLMMPASGLFVNSPHGTSIRTNDTRRKRDGSGHGSTCCTGHYWRPDEDTRSRPHRGRYRKRPARAHFAARRSSSPDLGRRQLEEFACSELLVEFADARL